MPELDETHLVVGRVVEVREMWLAAGGAAAALQDACLAASLLRRRLTDSPPCTLMVLTPAGLRCG